MHFLSLFNPNNKKELESIKNKLATAKPVLEMFKELYLSKRVSEIDKILDSNEKYDKPGYDRYISGLLSARSELKKIIDLLNF